MLEHGIDMLTLHNFRRQCEPISEEVVSRLAEICPFLSHLQLSEMYSLTETGRLSMVSLLRQIFHNNPPIQVLNMSKFSLNLDYNENIGELVLESLLASRISSITELNLNSN